MTKISNQYSLTNILTADLANSRLGINNVSPAYSLDLTGAARVTTSAYFATASGSVGIGTTSPSTKLHVYEALTNTTAYLTIQNNRARNAAVYTQTTNGGFYAGTSIGTDTFNYQIYDAVAGAARLTISSTGNVGIGTTSPSAISTYTTLDIRGATGGGLRMGVSGSSTPFNLQQAGTDAYLNNVANGAMLFFTNDAERMRIKSDGQVVIGDTSMAFTNADGHPFGVKSTGSQCFISMAYSGQTLASGGLSIGITTAAAYYFVRDYVPIIFATGNNERIRITNTGNLLLGTTTDSGYKLYVNGTSAGTSAFQNVSDRRFKKDVTPIESALSTVKLLNGVSFNWNKDSRPDLTLDDKNHLGLIAQDVEEILPQVVTTGIDELKTKTISYSDIVPVLIEAIKELSAENTSLINRIEALENK
jgi:hypothetical protein